MNFSIHLDDATQRQLDDYARLTRRPRSAIVREAVVMLLAQAQGRHQGWSPTVAQHLTNALNGDITIDELPPFESYRAELLPLQDLVLTVQEPAPAAPATQRRASKGQRR